MQSDKKKPTLTSKCANTANNLKFKEKSRNVYEADFIAIKNTTTTQVKLYDL